MCRRQDDADVLAEAQAEHDAAAAALAATAAAAARAITAASPHALTHQLSEEAVGAPRIGGGADSTRPTMRDNHSIAAEAAVAAGLPALLQAAGAAVGQRLDTLSSAIEATSGLEASHMTLHSAPNAVSNSASNPERSDPWAPVDAIAGLQSPGGCGTNCVDNVYLTAGAVQRKPAAARRLDFADAEAAAPSDPYTAVTSSHSRQLSEGPTAGIMPAGNSLATQQITHEAGAADPELGPVAAQPCSPPIQAACDAAVAAVSIPSRDGPPGEDREATLAAATAVVDVAIIRPLMAQHACVSHACKRCMLQPLSGTAHVNLYTK